MSQIRSDQNNDVTIEFNYMNRESHEPLDMDLILSREGTVPVQYAEIKSSLNNPSDRQLKQLEKMKAAASQGLTELPGCFTCAVSRQRAEELIAGGYYQFIVQIDPRTNRMTVYPAGHPITLPSRHTLQSGEEFAFAYSKIKEEKTPRSISDYWN